MLPSSSVRHAGDLARSSWVSGGNEDSSKDKEANGNTWREKESGLLTCFDGK